MTDTLDQQCIDMLRFLSVDMVQQAGSGHPGLPLGAAPMAYVLWARFMTRHPLHPQPCVTSNAHASTGAFVANGPPGPCGTSADSRLRTALALPDAP